MPWLWNQACWTRTTLRLWNQTYQICGAGLCQSGKFGSTTAALFRSSMSGSTTVAKKNPQPCRCGSQPGNPRTERNPAATVGPNLATLALHANPAAAVRPNLATLALHATQQPLWDPTWQPSPKKKKFPV
ncbi:hypothetical protein JOB18_030737 [Solea senegalensis]|uniref:Uncharacterized protein n=1 Tax=Solea senegalensis TaxID=28829 RepID=A0AAV6SH39_SOLSE|nr:hypothetical protein JOB18_030737 [Solea senegalensis]